MLRRIPVGENGSALCATRAQHCYFTTASLVVAVIDHDLISYQPSTLAIGIAARRADDHCSHDGPGSRSPLRSP
jgi:hypothetical protein